MIFKVDLLPTYGGSLRLIARTSERPPVFREEELVPIRELESNPAVDANPIIKRHLAKLLRRVAKSIEGTL